MRVFCIRRVRYREDNTDFGIAFGWMYAYVLRKG